MTSWFDRIVYKLRMHLPRVYDLLAKGNAAVTIALYGGRMILCEMRREIRDVFAMLSLKFEIHDTLHEALDATTA